MTDCPACDVDHARGAPECPGRRVGTTFVDKYRLLRVLGCGGMGVVYEAEHVALGRRCAVKLMLTSVLGVGSAAGRFEHEARRVAALDHPGIVRIHDAGRDASGTLFIEMELLDGESFEDWAARRPSPAACVETIAAALEGLAEAHQRSIVHRDIKPDNIFLTRGPGGARRVVILDFGIAREVAGGEQRTQAGAVLGTLAYMSPEQLEDSASADARADVFAMAATLYRALVGHPPVVGNRQSILAKLLSRDYPRSARSAGAAITPQLDRVIAVALEPNPERRPRDASVFRAQLLGAGVSGPAPTELEEDVPPPGAPAPTEFDGEVAPPPLPVGSQAVLSPTTPIAVGPAPSVATPPSSARRVGVAVIAIVALTTVVLVAWRGFGSSSPDAAREPDAAPPRDAGIDAPSVPAEMIRLAGGSVTLGIDDAAKFEDWCTNNHTEREICSRMLATGTRREEKVGAFLIDRDEVIWRDFLAWLNKLGGREVDGVIRYGDLAIVMTSCDPNMKRALGLLPNANGDDARPATCMTFEAAERYCHDHGKRLPKSAEWVFAVREGATELRSYSCDDAVFGRFAKGACSHSPSGPVRSGTSRDVTPSGVRSLRDNVSEWVDEPASDGKRLARGGNWGGVMVDLHATKQIWLGGSARFAGAPTIGFRCARAP